MHKGNTKHKRSNKPIKTDTANALLQPATCFVHCLWLVLILIISLFMTSCSQQEFVSTFPEKEPETLPIGENAPKQAEGGVLFAFKPAESAGTVSVAGTFNGWNPEADIMEKGDDGVYRIIKKLEPGKYFYKYVIDRGRWIPDPHNPHKGETGYDNAILTVQESGEVFIRNKVVGPDNPGRFYSQYAAVESAPWVKGAIIYEVFTRTFSEEGFQGLMKKLDYLKELGVNTLWIMPIHKIGEVKRKGELGSPYSVQDYYSVNPEFGSKEDFRNLVKHAHKMDMKVIIDWVANHSAWDNDLVNEHPEYYTKNEKGEIISPMPGWSDVADFNYDNPNMRVYMHKALQYWVREFDIDGYRMDTAAIVPLDFWRKARKNLLRIKDDIMLLAESDEEIHHVGAFDLTYEGGIRNVIKKIAEGEAEQYDFYRAWMRQKYAFPKGALRLHWLENHDRQHALRYYGRSAIYPASTILLTLEGPVLLLMGQEFGDRNWQNNSSLFDPLQLAWDRFDDKLFAHYQKLCQLRNQHAALSRGKLTVIENDNKRVISYLRTEGDEIFLVTVNLGSTECSIVLDPEALRKHNLDGKLQLKEVYPEAHSDTCTLADTVISLPAQNGKVFRITRK